MSANYTAAKSLAIPGEPLIYIGDPLGKSYAIMDTFQLHNHEDKPTIQLRRIRPVDVAEVEKLRVRFELSSPLADRQWYEVTSD